MTQPKAASARRYGTRTYAIPLGGELVQLPGVSSLPGMLASFTLERWKREQVAAGLAQRPDLVMLAGHPDTLRSATEQALSLASNKANVGTAVHAYCEERDRGTLDFTMIPASARPYVNHYAQTVKEHGVVPLHVERTIFNFTEGYAGTFDRVYDIPGLGVVIGDIKTGKTVYPEVALQLAMYANGEGIWTPPAETPDTDELRANLASDKSNGMTKVAIKKAEAEIEQTLITELAALGTKEPMPDGLRTDVAVVVHLTAEGCHIIPVQIGGAYRAVLGLCDVRRWQAERNVVGKPLQPTEVNDAHTDTRPHHPGDRVPDHLDDQGAPIDDNLSAHPVSVLPAPVDLVDTQRLDGRRTKVYEHLRWLPADAMQLVAGRWPAGVPGFKTQPWSHTAEQLDAIETVMRDVEAEQRLPFYPPDDGQPLETIFKHFPNSQLQKDGQP